VLDITQLERQTLRKFAQNLKKLRLERGLTQAQLADRIQVSRRLYQRYETDAPPVLNVIYVMRLAKVLKVTLESLLE
jgi:transcriptional regulator with XRE-family HTH domain